MFYVKTEFEGKKVKIELFGSEIHTTCTKCYKEIQIDKDFLRDLLSDEDFSFGGTSIACCNRGQQKFILIK